MVQWALAAVIARTGSLLHYEIKSFQEMIKLDLTFYPAENYNENHQFKGAAPRHSLKHIPAVRQKQFA